MVQLKVIQAAALISVLTVLALNQGGRAQQQQQQQQDGEEDSSLISPTPRDYFALYQRACQQRRGKSELLELYSNQSRLGNLRLRQLVRKTRFERECRREPSAWRLRYFDEAGTVSIRESSIDERLSNVAYTTRTTKAFAIDSYLYDSGDKEMDARNMEMVAGSQVNDELCGQDLEQMLSLIGELAERNRRLAAGQPAVLTDQHISLAKILDSYGRYASGSLYGRVMSVGSYDQCRTNRLIVNATYRTPMRFCWAHLSLEKHLDGSLRERFRDELETKTDVLTAGVCLPASCHSRSFSKFRAQFQALLDSQFKLPAALYVEQSLPVHSLYCLVDADSAFRVPLFGRLLLGYAALWVALTILVTLRNARNRRHAPGAAAAKTSAWSSLDLVDSWADFLSARERAGRLDSVELNTINVVKVAGSLLVVLAHALAIFIGYSMDEVYSATFLEREPVTLILVAVSLLVDTFFAISGILWAYFTLKRLHKYDNRNSAATRSAHADWNQTKLVGLKANNEQNNSNNNNNNDDDECAKSFVEMQFVEQVENAAADLGNNTDNNNGQLERGENYGVAAAAAGIQPSDGWRFLFTNWLMLTLFRYLRIVPLFVLVHWFKKFVYIYAGSGPLWDHGFNSKSFNGACRAESMWTPFTFLSAYYPLSHQCTLQSWSISNDMFFAILAPPAIILIYKRPRLAIWFSAIMCALSCWSVMRAVANTPSAIDEELRELRAWGFYRLFDKASQLYTAPHFRIFCFLSGVWGGYFLHQLQLRLAGGAGAAPAPASWPWWMRGPATWASVAYMVVVVMALVQNGLMKAYLDPLYRALYPQFVSSVRFVWALANTVLFLRMMTDWKDSFWMRLSSAKFWQILTKLNYPILLVHMDLLLFTVQVARSPPTNVTIWTFINMGMGVFLCSIPISILLHVVYENPVDKLIRSFLPKY